MPGSGWQKKATLTAFKLLTVQQWRLTFVEKRDVKEKTHLESANSTI